MSAPRPAPTDGVSPGRPVGTVGLVGAVYLAAGIAFGALSGAAATPGMRVAWRLAAWVVSAVAFALQIGYEQLRLRRPSFRVALHASTAAALGAFGLAVAAAVHAHRMGRALGPFTLAMVVWPAMTMVPAFAVALAAAAVLARVRRGA